MAGLKEPDDDEVFEQFLDHNTALIRRLARDGRWRIPYQDVEETEADLAVMLYHAYLHHKPGLGTFRAYFNTLWVKFKTKRIRDMMRMKRSVLVIVLPLDHFLADEDDDTPFGSGGRSVLPAAYDDPPYVPLPFRGIDPWEEVVWRMIQLGYSPADVVQTLPLSRTRYNALIRAWKDNIMTITTILGVDR